MRRRFLRRGPIEFEVECGTATHRLRCDGNAVELVDHAGDDAEMVLATLGGAGLGYCFDVADAWRHGRVDDVPPVLKTLVVERWRRAGVDPMGLRDFLSAVQGRPPVSRAFGPSGRLHPSFEAALWREALRERPRPETVGEFFGLGVNVLEACAWSEALGRPVRPADVVRGRASGIADGYEACEIASGVTT